MPIHTRKAQAGISHHSWQLSRLHRPTGIHQDIGLYKISNILLNKVKVKAKHSCIGMEEMHPECISREELTLFRQSH